MTKAQKEAAAKKFQKLKGLGKDKGVSRRKSRKTIDDDDDDSENE